MTGVISRAICPATAPSLTPNVSPCLAETGSARRIEISTDSFTTPHIPRAMYTRSVNRGHPTRATFLFRGASLLCLNSLDTIGAIMKRTLSLILILVATVATAHAQTYSITDLGALPGATSTFAYGMNDNGDVAGWSSNGSVLTGYIWSRGVMTSTGWLGNPGSSLFAVNLFGQGVGWAN